jgi:hypothetical protein
MDIRARQLAMTVIYPSPMPTMCDHSSDYRNQPGIEFFRELSTLKTLTRKAAARICCISNQSLLFSFAGGRLPFEFASCRTNTS